MFQVAVKSVDLVIPGSTWHLGINGNSKRANICRVEKAICYVDWLVFPLCRDRNDDSLDVCRGGVVGDFVDRERTLLRSKVAESVPKDLAARKPPDYRGKIPVLRCETAYEVPSHRCVSLS